MTQTQARPIQLDTFLRLLDPFSYTISFQEDGATKPRTCLIEEVLEQTNPAHLAIPILAVWTTPHSAVITRAESHIDRVSIILRKVTIHA